jgi:hypothetical protein
MKMTSVTISVLATAMLGMAALFTSCDKSVDNMNDSPSHLDIYLTDSPGDYQEVWVDIQKVMINTPGADSTDSAGWKEVPLLRPGLYNLLDFRNGADTVLGGVDLPAGTVSQIRLILGNDNYLVLDDGTKVPLTTPSAQQSGLKLNIHAELKPGIPYALVLDFDAARSVVEAGNSGKYSLKPVIRTFAKEAGGAMEGVVLPDSARAHIIAIMNTDTLSAIPDSTGYYKFWGVPEGGYQLTFSADTTTGYQSDTLDNVMVKTGAVTKVDTVWLNK